MRLIALLLSLCLPLSAAAETVRQYCPRCLWLPATAGTDMSLATGRSSGSSKK